MSKRQRKILLTTTPLAVIFALVLAAAVKLDHLQRDAELLATTGKAAINLLKEVATGIQEGDPGRILAVYDPACESPGEGPWEPRLVSERDGVTVWDWEEVDPRPGTRERVGERVRGLLDGIARVELVKFKLDRVEEIHGEEEAVIRAVLWLRGTDREGLAFESFGHFRIWIARREIAAGGEGGEGEGGGGGGEGVGGWTITRQDLLHGQTVTGERRGFTDVAREVGIDFVAHKNPKFATPEWFPKTFEIIQYGTAGASAVDYDGDGWYDLFFGDGLSARLFHNAGDGTFTDATASAGLPVALHANVGLFADFDGDGDPDLFTGAYTDPHRLFRNDGDGTFTDVTETAGLGGYFAVVASASDYDGDGDLDLYVGRYLDARKDLPTTLFYTRNGQGNVLLRNDGGLHFTDVTAETGAREGGLTLGTVWGDYDRDGDQDVYVANDFGRNALLANQLADGGGAVFTDVTAATGSLDFGFGMSADASDVDGDGDLDLYVSNVHSGQRWYGQAATLQQYLLTSVRQGTIREDFSLYREIFGYAGADWRHYGDGMVKGNSLLLNDGSGHFTDGSEIAGANPFGWYWGSVFFDYDNDGREDLYAANGWISGETYDDL